MCDQKSLRSAWAYSQSDQSLCLSFEYYMSFKLLTEHHLEFLSLKWGCTGSSECSLVKIPHCWKSHVAAQMLRKVVLYYFLCPLRSMVDTVIMTPSASSSSSSELSHFWFQIDNSWRIHQFHSNFTEGSSIIKYRSSSKKGVFRKILWPFLLLRFWLNCGFRSITFEGMQLLQKGKAS